MRIPLLCSIMAFAATTGCESQPTEMVLGPTHEQAYVALGLVDDGMGPVTFGADAFVLGAGDELGREMFVVYVASIEQDAFYATGQSDFIDDQP